MVVPVQKLKTPEWGNPSRTGNRSGNPYRLRLHNGYNGKQQTCKKNA
jgi:hypothetical protein